MHNLLYFSLLISVGTLSCENPGQLTLWDQNNALAIYLPENPHPLEQQAAQQLQFYLQQISGQAFVLTEATREDPPGIFLRGVPLEEPQQVTYRVAGDKLIIAGGSPLYTLYAVYSFLEKELGCRFYHPDAEQIPTYPSWAIDRATEYVYQPAITTRTVHSRLFYADSLFADKQKVSYEAFPHYVPGARVHTFHRLLPAAVFYASHPEYYALRNGKRIPTQLCLTNESVFEIVKDSVAAWLSAHPEASVISVSQDDNTQYCQCEQCEAIHEAEASPSGSMVYFVNRIAQAFPDKQISTLAYQYTRKAPKTIAPEPNVLITLCSIECDRSAPIAEKCEDFAQDLRDWGAKTDNIRIWDYTTQFTNFLSPFPNLYTLQPNLQLFRDNSAKWVFEQHSNQPSELFELRSYLTAKLLWNPDSDPDSIMAEFANGYYGVAGPFVLRYVSRLHEELQADSSFFLFLYGDPSQAFGSYLSAERLQEYDRLFDQATQAVADQDHLVKRVNQARLSTDYAILEQAKLNLSQALAADGFPLTERLARFQQSTTEGNISMMNEMRYSVAEYLTLYERTLERAQQANLAIGKPVQLLTKPKKYAKEDPQTLTDGAFGSSSFYANWLGFEGNHLEAIVDLGEVMEIKEMSAGFLQVTNHVVFFPLEVQYLVSLDGEQFRPWGKVANRHPLQPTSTVNDIQYFTFQGKPIRARYLKIVARNQLVAPIWHHAADLPAWIFMDELEVR